MRIIVSKLIGNQKCLSEFYEYSSQEVIYGNYVSRNR